MNDEPHERARPYGRALSDFAPLTTGEQRLLEACRNGLPCHLTDARKRDAILGTLLADSPTVEAIKAAVLSGRMSAVLENRQETEGELVAEVLREFTAFASAFRSGNVRQGRLQRDLFTSFVERFKAQSNGWRAVSIGDDGTTVRGGFLRFLLLGGDRENPVHESGIRLSGAHIIGVADDDSAVVNLTGSEIPFALRLEGCRIDGAMCLDGARTRNVTLTGSHLQKLSLRSAQIQGDLILNKGLTCDGLLDLSGARISGDVDCEGGSFVAPSDKTIVGDSSKISGSVKLSKGCVSLGQISLANARIGGQLALYGGFFGQSEFASVGGLPETVHARRRLKFVLDLKNLVAGQIFWGPIFPVSAEPATIIGSVNLVAAQVENFIFDPASLPPRSVELVNGERADCTVTLDGFRYEHLGVPAGNDLIKSMFDLFSQQPSRHVDQDFRPQPYEQLTKTLVEMGRERDAKTVAQKKAAGLRRQEWFLLKQDLAADMKRPSLTKADGKAGCRRIAAATEWIAWPITAVLAVLTAAFNSIVLAGKWIVFNGFLGAGHRHVPTYTAFAALWLVCGWIYHEASQTPGAFVPVDKNFVQNDKNRAACGGNKDAKPIHWTKCSSDRVSELNAFRPYVYSLDLMLQFGPLGQKRSWEPVSNRPLEINLDVPLYGRMRLQPGVLWYITLVQSLLSIFLYILIAKMLSTQIREK